MVASKNHIVVLISAKVENGKEDTGSSSLSRGAREIGLSAAASVLEPPRAGSVITLLCPSIFECRRNGRERPFQITKL